MVYRRLWVYSNTGESCKVQVHGLTTESIHRYDLSPDHLNPA